MSIGLDANWITALATLVLALINAFFLYLIHRQLKQIEEQNKTIRKQTEIIKQQYEAQVESFLRSNTINTLSTWLKTFERKAILARHILSELNDNDIKSVHDFKPISIQTYSSSSREKILNLIYALELRFMEDPNLASFVIPEYVATYIRSLMTEYLNTLEIILLAWDQGIVDEKVFTLEFSYLLDKHNQCVLEKILNIWGKENYPVIEKFCNRLKQLKQKQQNSKPTKEPLNKKLDSV